MLPDWIPPLGIRYKKMDTSTKNSAQKERSMEEAQEQVEIPDFGATFLARLYSHRAWDETIGEGASKTKKTKEQKTKNCPAQSFSPVYSFGKEPIGPPESTLRVVVMYVKTDTPFEWTDDYKEFDLERKIEAYNSIVSGMKLTPLEDGFNFGGHIRVNMDLSRPIEAVERVVPSPIQKTVNVEKSTAKPTPTVKISETILPQNTTEVINVDSKTTARQMIVKVFKNLRMVNYPREYALFEYVQQIDESAGTLTKKWTQIADDACPLKVVLNWPIPHCGRALVLQEKDTRDVQGDNEEVNMRSIYSKVTGLDRVDVKMKEKSHTGLFETTLSKRVPSKRDCEECVVQQDPWLHGKLRTASAYHTIHAVDLFRCSHRSPCRIGHSTVSGAWQCRVIRILFSLVFIVLIMQIRLFLFARDN